MGQCMSRKAAGAFAASAAAAHNRPTKGKHAKYQSPEEDNRDTSTLMKNNRNSSSRGVAMSFGFKRRPTTAPSALTTPNANAARRLANTDVIDSNGNDRNDDDTRPLTANAQLTGRSTPRLPPPKKEGIASQRVSRFGFRQPQVNRMNKVADLNADPLEFGAPKNSAPQRPLPTNTVSLQNKYKSSGIGVGVETTGCVDNNRNRTGATKTTAQAQTNQVGKYTLQTTLLPRPQPVRVMETKTAKTLANNNMKLANAGYRRASPDDSSKDGSLTEDSGVGSHIGPDFDNCSFSPITGKYKQRNLEIMLNGNTFDVRDMDVSMEVNLPKLPSVFRETPNNNSNLQKTGVVRERTLEYERHIDKGLLREISATSSEGFSDTSCQNDNTMHKPQFVTQKSFLKSKPSPVKTFLKSKVVDNTGHSSSASSDEHEWTFGGEAMADEVSFSISSSDESRDRDYGNMNTSKDSDNFSVHETRAGNNPFVKKFIPSLPLRTEFRAVTLTIADTNIQSTAKTTDALLDDETSPIDSLLSFSESEEVLKRTLHQNSSESKDTNEKLSPPSPGTPTNASNSLSLSEGKDDFLIDDEIADQPALVFGDKSQHNSETTLVESTPRSRRKKLRNFEGSPLIMKDKKILRGSTVSLDTLSPCESIASDDLMMDYDYSQSSGLDDCDKFEKKCDRAGQNFEESIGSIGSIETEIKNNEQLRDWSALLNCSNDKNMKCSPRPRFLRSRTGTPNSDPPSSLDGKPNGRSRTSTTSTPLRRIAHASSLGYESDDSVVKIDRASHAAIKNDIVSVKAMLLKLWRVLNEQSIEDTLSTSETRNPFDNQANGHLHGGCSELNSCGEVEEDSRGLELSDLRRQLLFLQGQIEDREKTVQSLQEQITRMSVDNYLSNSAPASTVITEKDVCNAATQTERIRPLSVGPPLSNGTQVEPSQGSLISVTELPRRTRTPLRTEIAFQKKTPMRRRIGESPTLNPTQQFSNPTIPTSLVRRSESRSRVAPSSLT